MLLLVMFLWRYNMWRVEYFWFVLLNVEWMILLVICLSRVVELMIMIFWLFVFVISGMIGLFLVVRVWLMVCVVFVFFVNVMFVVRGCVMILVFNVLFFGKKWSVLVGILFFCNRLIVFFVIKGVFLDGLVMIVLLVLRVVVIWLMKIVRGKFYGLIYINVLWLWRFNLFCLFVGFISCCGFEKRCLVLWV